MTNFDNANVLNNDTNVEQNENITVNLLIIISALVGIFLLAFIVFLIVKRHNNLKNSVQIFTNGKEHSYSEQRSI